MSGAATSIGRVALCRSSAGVHAGLESSDDDDGDGDGDGDGDAALSGAVTVPTGRRDREPGSADQFRAMQRPPERQRSRCSTGHPRPGLHAARDGTSPRCPPRVAML
jgi:hypothetical protein